MNPQNATDFVATRELTVEELELASGGTIVLEEAAPMPWPPGPSLIGPDV